LTRGLDFLNTGITTVGWADRAAAVAGNLERHASPGLRDQLVSLVAQARSFEAQARSISQGLHDLLLQFESGLPPGVLPTHQSPQIIVADQDLRRSASNNTAGLVSPVTRSTRSMNRNIRNGSYAITSLPSGNLVQTNIPAPMNSHATPLSPVVRQPSGEVALPSSQMLAPNWAIPPTGIDDIRTANINPTMQPLQTVTPSAPMTNSSYQSASYSSDGFDNGYPSLTLGALTTPSANAVYLSNTPDLVSQSYTRHSNPSCNCNNCWIREYGSQARL
jgi:hypothetical protein